MKAEQLAPTFLLSPDARSLNRYLGLQTATISCVHELASAYLCLVIIQCKL